MCCEKLLCKFVVQNVDFASYADDNTTYDAGDNIDEVIFSWQDSSKNLFKNGLLIIKWKLMKINAI